MLWSIVFGKPMNTMNTTTTTRTTTISNSQSSSSSSSSSSSHWYRPLTVGELRNVEIRVGGMVKVTFRGMPWQGYPDHWTEPTTPSTPSTTIATIAAREEAPSQQPVAVALHASSLGTVVIALFHVTHRQYQRFKEQVDPEDVLDWLLLHCNATSPVHIQGLHFQKDAIQGALHNWNLWREKEKEETSGEEAETTNQEEQPNNNNKE